MARARFSQGDRFAMNAVDLIDRPLVRVHIPAALRPLVQGERSICVAAADVRTLLQGLCTNYAGLAEMLLEPGGCPKRFIKIYVNEEDAQLARGVDTALENGDHVYIMPAVCGD